MRKGRGRRSGGHEVRQARADVRGAVRGGRGSTPCSDAGIRPRRSRALYVGNVVGEAGERQLHMGPQVASALGMPAVAATRFETACASSHAAFRHALFEIASGAADVLLVGGAERVLTMPTERSTEVFAYASDASSSSRPG